VHPLASMPTFISAALQLAPADSPDLTFLKTESVVDASNH
jgi:hypothetical protein